VRRVLFLTGTRADFGKVKPLISAVEAEPALDYLIVATGMHLDDRYGRTELEITKSGFKNLVSFSNSGPDDSMDYTLARTIMGLSPILIREQPDLLVIHGDRVEALAGAITGALNNVLVAHVEGENSLAPSMNLCDMPSPSSPTFTMLRMSPQRK